MHRTRIAQRGHVIGVRYVIQQLQRAWQQPRRPVAEILQEAIGGDWQSEVRYHASCERCRIDLPGFVCHDRRRCEPHCVERFVLGLHAKQLRYGRRPVERHKHPPISKRMPAILWPMT
jgi:hypothetical protein